MIDILDLHTHTIASGHAYNTLYEMIEAASLKGLQLFGSTDHAPSMPGACHPFYFINFKAIPRQVHGVTVLMGSELNILDYDGTIDLSEKYLKGLDYTIASIHDVCYDSGTLSQNTSAYLGALKNPYVNIIGHPDDSRFPVDYDTLAAAAANHHKLIEVNSSSLNPLCPRVNARENYSKLLEYCRHYHTHIVINSDAHVEADVGNHVRAHQLLDELDFPEDLIVNTSIEKLAAFLPAFKRGHITIDKTSFLL